MYFKTELKRKKKQQVFDYFLNVDFLENGIIKITANLKLTHKCKNKY